MYNFKLQLDTFFKKANYDTSKEDVTSLITLCKNSNLKELKSFHNTLVNWKNEICNSLIKIKTQDHKYTYINNGKIKSRIELLKTLKIKVMDSEISEDLGKEFYM